MSGEYGRRLGKGHWSGPPAESEDLAYAATVRLAGECSHGVIGGAVIRPWTGSVSCSMCRRGNPETWRRVPYLTTVDPAPPAATVESAHGVMVCEYGIVHGRCQCGDGTERAVPCDRPTQHRPRPARRRRTIRPRADA